MSDSFLDHLPSGVQERLKQRLRSPAEYERLREKVKGPEDLEREMEKMDVMAEVHFTLETEPKAQESLKAAVEKDIAEQGIEAVLETAPSPEGKKAIEQGKFQMKVEAVPGSHVDKLVAVPEGKVQEKLPIKPSLSDRYVGQLTQKKRGSADPKNTRFSA